MPRPKLNLPWRYDQVDLRDDVSLIIKDTKIKIEIWKVFSGDSGTNYYVQLLRHEGQCYWFCLCGNGFPMIPLEAFHLGEHCKHIKNLIVFMKERKKL